MAILTASHPVSTPTREARPGTRRLRPGRGTGRTGGPSTRPLTAVPAPRLAEDARVELAWAPEPVAPPLVESSWRLTERGVAIVVVTGLMIVTAALTVIGLTALRVTGESASASQIAPIGTSATR